MLDGGEYALDFDVFRCREVAGDGFLKGGGEDSGQKLATESVARRVVFLGKGVSG